MSTNVAVIVHSTAGSTMTLAEAIKEGAGEVSGADVRLRRVPDLISDDELANNPRFGRLFSSRVAHAAVASTDDLEWADAIILGCGTRFGGMSAAMRKFLEQAGGLWMSGRLAGKVGGVFTAASSPHGGMEQTLHDLITAMMHFGLIIAPPGYIDPVVHRASSPYGAVAQAGGRSGMQPTDDDVSAARFLGGHVATIARKLNSAPLAAAAA